MFKKDTSGGFVVEKIGWGVNQYQFRSESLKTPMLSDIYYQQLLQRQERTPVAVMKNKGKTWWMFKGNFYYEDEGYSAEKVISAADEEEHKIVEGAYENETKLAKEKRLLFTGFAGSAEKFDEKMDAVNPNSLLHLENIKKWQLEREERFKKEEIEKRYFKPSSEAYVKQEGSASLSSRREPIPTKVRREVWKRDGGKCVKCGSQEKLEFDHIIPLSKKGSNTARNIELLCEKCNRSKGGSII